VPGWAYEFEENVGVVESVTWSGGEIGPREFQQFVLQTKTPEEGGEFAWNAFQTYEDGSVDEWVGPEDAEEPAPVVRVASGGVENDGQGAAKQESRSADLPTTGTIVPIAAYGGFGLGALALVVALVALLCGNK